MTADQLKAVYSAIRERGACDEDVIAEVTGFTPDLVEEALDILQDADLVAETNVADMRYRTKSPATGKYLLSQAAA